MATTSCGFRRAAGYGFVLRDRKGELPEIICDVVTEGARMDLTHDDRFELVMTPEDSKTPEPAVNDQATYGGEEFDGPDAPAEDVEAESAEVDTDGSPIATDTPIAPAEASTDGPENKFL